MDLRLKIKKRTQPEWLVWLLIFAPFSFGVLFDFLPVPALLKYVVDVAWVMLLIIVAMNMYRQKIKMDSDVKTLSIWVLAFLIFTFVTYIFNYQSALYYIMGVRNNFRFYVAFLSFIFFIQEDDVDTYLKLFDYIFWINAVVMLFQYFALGYNQDNLGGLFGTQSGCNGYVNIFFVIICAKSIVFYLDKKEKTLNMMSKCAAALLLATFAEIKFFFIEFFVIILVAVLVSGNSVRKILVISSGVIAVFISVNLLFILFPYFSNLNTFETLWEHQMAGYTGSDTIGRLSSIPMISELFFDTIPKKLAGLGLGNCDTSNVSFLNTPFYQTYGYLRYFWFSTAHITLETGYIGFTLFSGFFAMVAILSAINIKKNSPHTLYFRLSVVAAISCILVVIYNSSLRTEAAYMIYFILSLPFALKNNSIGMNES